MPLKTFVKVGKITNLSDARYCSGMGVDVLGFEAIEGSQHYVPPSVYQLIRGWVAGPKIAAALYGLTDVETLKKILDNYQPDYLELGEHELSLVAASTTLPLMLSISSNFSSDSVKEWKDRIAYIQILEQDVPALNHVLNDFPVIIELQSPENLKQLLSLLIKGISLNGSPEVRPGFKDYDDLASVLEELEENS